MACDMKNAWNLIKSVFPILQEPVALPFNETASDDFYNAVNVINSLNITAIVQTLTITQIEKFSRAEVAPRFWSFFTKPSSEYNGFQKFSEAVELLHTYYIHLSTVATKINLMRECNNHRVNIYNECDAVESLKVIIRATILSQLPLDHKSVIENFYELALRLEEQRNGSGSEVRCTVCAADISKCSCTQCFANTNRKLVELGLLEPLVGQVLTDLIYSYIEKHIQKTCKDSFDTSHIENLEKWLDTVVIRWLKKIYCPSPDMATSSCIDKFIKKLISYLYEMYTKIRINELFNIIIEFPESLPALEDLRLTLPKTDLRALLTKKLQKAMETRLLHPGVSTPDILTAYIATIRTMRVLDPSGLLLETITQPIHQYLRRREDTVRCVVSSLTEEGSNDLAEELARSEEVQVDENSPSDEDAENWETWTPDPVDTVPDKLPNVRRTSDIISMLVNVYGSKELFVNEYRTLLADRLLSQFACDTEKEIRYLELLKLRFGDSQLHYCEVMLKDIQDSKRINQHIKQDVNYAETTPMSAVIVSAQFWPAFKEEKLELHPSLLEQLDTYTKAFETLKGSRTLCWKNHLGTVELEVELGDRTLTLNVTPIQATILQHFQDKNEWSLDELSKVMQVPPTLLKKKISFWQSHGLLAEKNNVFYLVEEQDNKQKNQPAEIVEDFESESVMASTQDQREEELQTFWSYIVGMLMNLDTLPLERIHQMLKMFAFQGPTIECNIQELKIFLDRKVREHQLIFSGGLYKLPKS